MPVGSKIGPALAERLSSGRDYDRHDVMIFVRGSGAERPVAVLNPSAFAQALAANARLVQRDLVGYLLSLQTRMITLATGRVLPSVEVREQFWINNSIRAEVSESALEEIVLQGSVEYVELSRQASFSDLSDVPEGAAAFSYKLLDERIGAETDREVGWGVKRVQAPRLWEMGITGRGVIVAVVDSGVNYSHPDLAERMWQSPRFPNHGYDFENDDNDPTDDDGHGTACAGIVAGNGTSGKKTGVAPDCSIMAIRVGGTEAQHWHGLQFALENGANIISMSLTWKYPQKPDNIGWRRACESIASSGVVHVNSVGNQGDRTFKFPVPFNIGAPGNCPPPYSNPLSPLGGGLSSVISCGATDNRDSLAASSGRGPVSWGESPYTDYPYSPPTALGLVKPDLCAPGPGTDSCNNLFQKAANGTKPYVPFGGTSAATPHVAGCIALLYSACLVSSTAPRAERFLEALEKTAVRIGGQTMPKELNYGAGRIDVLAAYLFGHSRGWW